LSKIIRKIIRAAIFTDGIILELKKSFITGKQADKTVLSEFPLMHKCASYRACLKHENGELVLKIRAKVVRLPFH